MSTVLLLCAVLGAQNAQLEDTSPEIPDVAGDEIPAPAPERAPIGAIEAVARDTLFSSVAGTSAGLLLATLETIVVSVPVIAFGLLIGLVLAILAAVIASLSGTSVTSEQTTFIIGVVAFIVWLVGMVVLSPVITATMVVLDALVFTGVNAVAAFARTVGGLSVLGADGIPRAPSSLRPEDDMQRAGAITAEGILLAAMRAIAGAISAGLGVVVALLGLVPLVAMIALFAESTARPTATLRLGLTFENALLLLAAAGVFSVVTLVAVDVVIRPALNVITGGMAELLLRRRAAPLTRLEAE